MWGYSYIVSYMAYWLCFMRRGGWMMTAEKTIKENYIPIILWSTIMDLLIQEYTKTRDERFLDLYYDMKFSQQAYRYDLGYFCECSKEFLERLGE